MILNIWFNQYTLEITDIKDMEHLIDKMEEHFTDEEIVQCVKAGWLSQAQQKSAQHEICDFKMFVDNMNAVLISEEVAS